MDVNSINEEKEFLKKEMTNWLDLLDKNKAWLEFAEPLDYLNYLETEPVVKRVLGYAEDLILYNELTVEEKGFIETLKDRRSYDKK